MVTVINNLLVGTVAEVKAHPEQVVVNLAHSYHYDLHKWTRRDGIDHSTDPCYLVCEELPHILSVNWVDSPDPSFFNYNGQGVEIFHKIFDFIDKQIKEGSVRIVCNKAESRAPSVAMAYLAKRTNVLSRPVVNTLDIVEGDVLAAIDRAKEFEKPTYPQAREKFIRMYPGYYPGSGITSFLIDHWEEL